MNLLVIGATGRTGRHLVELALARGHSVTGLVRRIMPPGRNRNLDFVVGDPTRAVDLEPILPRSDAVISCLGQRSRADADLLRNSAAATLDAMTRTNVRRYLVVSQGLLFPSKNPFIALLRVILGRQVADSTAMEEVICASDLAWTIVRPPKLSEGGKTRGYRIKLGSAPEGPWAMQYADLAQFLLDEAEQGRYPRAIVGITSG